MRTVWVGVVVVGLGQLGCEQREASDQRTQHSQHVAATVTQRELYEGHGTVLWSEPGRVYLNHDEILGFMDAMAMGFDVRDSELLEKLEPGASVEFRVVVSDDSFFIDQIYAVPPSR